MKQSKVAIETNSRKFWISLSLLSLAIILFYLSPLFFFGEGTLHVPVFDFLDITLPTLKILARSGMIFAPSDTIIPDMMGGLPRLSYGSEFDYMLWLLVFFAAFHG
jgi:hypothetical protein